MTTKNAMKRQPRDITLDEHCPLCEADRAILLTSRGRNNAPCHMLMCGHCGLLYRSRQDNAAMADLYVSEDYAENNQWQGMAAPSDCPSKLFRRLSPLMDASRPLPGASVLEVGFGRGVLLHDLGRAGAKVHGVEPMRRYREAAENVGYRVFADLDDISDQSYDLIVMTDVIEHIADPAPFLARCRELLAPKGRLVLTTPNTEAPWTPRPHWTDWFDTGHYYGFSPQHVRHLLALAGLAVARAESGASIFIAATPGTIANIPLDGGAERVRAAFASFRRWHWLRHPLWRAAKSLRKTLWGAASALKRFGR